MILSRLPSSAQIDVHSQSMAIRNILINQKCFIKSLKNVVDKNTSDMRWEVVCFAQIFCRLNTTDETRG